VGVVGCDGIVQLPQSFFLTHHFFSCSCPYGTKGIFVYDNDESRSKDHLGITDAAYYTTNVNQGSLCLFWRTTNILLIPTLVVTILRKSDK
jgi:hypothetical protein